MKKVVYGIAIFAFVLLLTACGKQKFTVTFDTDGGSTIEAIEVTKNQSIAKPSDPTKENFEFLGWYLNGEEFEFDSKITEDITLKAKWRSKDSELRIVSFDSDGGSKVNSITVKVNDKIISPKEPTKEGYKFLGWYLKDKKFDFNSKITEDITLVAKWEKIATTNSSSSNNTSSKPVNSEVEKEQYKITFDSTGGTSVNSQTVEESKKVTRPTNPTKEGYTFVTWLLENGAEYNFDMAVTSSFKLVAKWKENAPVVEPEKDPVLEYKIIPIQNSIAHEALLYVYADGKAVDGIVDIETIAGSKITGKEIPATGFKIDDREIKSVSNIRLK